MEQLKSFKRKIIAVVAASLVIAILLISAICIQHLAAVRQSDSKQIMELLCAQYAEQTNRHLETVEQTVNLLYRYALENLTAKGDIRDVDNAMSVIARTRMMAFGAASNIDTAHAVYLRLNPELYGRDSVFFLVRNGEGFDDVTPTDLSAYDRDDIEHVGWYYVPLDYGAPLWTEPYDNRNIGVYMISYVIPIIHEGEEIGVMGMDLDLSGLHEAVNTMNPFQGGYTYLEDRDGATLFDATDRHDDGDWLTVSRTLHNRMRLSVTAPWWEIDAAQRQLVDRILLTALAVLLVGVGVAVWVAVRINRKLATELDRAHRAQMDALNAANQASLAKSDFLSRMSHDIRTPMNAIIGMTSIAGAHLDEPEKVKDCIGKIGLSSRHLLGIINDILDMSKIESGKLQLRESKFSLPALIDELLELTGPQARAKRHTVMVQLNNIVHEDLIGDDRHLQQALVNIMSNAVKYTPPGGSITLTVTERQTQNPHVGRFEFVFEDDGIGMSPELAAMIFEPFERGEDLRISKIQGTGLGMAITKSIIQYMGGTIRVESEEGKGSRFTVSVTLKLRKTAPADAGELAGLSVLVADDDPVSRTNTCRMLAELGMHGEGAAPGREAQEKAAARLAEGTGYDAAILDRNTAAEADLEEIRALRAAGGEALPVILAAFDWSAVTEGAHPDLVHSFLSKPIFKSTLLHTLRGLRQPKQETPGPSDSLAELGGQDYSANCILLVEDNALNREMAVEIVSITGAAVETAEDGEHALQKIRSVDPGTYDLILMDVQMPRMNGYEATRAIRALPGWEKVPIIAMTANTFDEDVQAALKAGMNEHLAKPIDIGQLGAVLQRWLGRGKG